MSIAATQSHIPVASLEEGVVILKDGSLAVVIRIYPINFDLKNESEQNTIIARYQGFLNSLEFPIQILIRSRELDLHPYLADLQRHAAQIDNELLQRQATDYISFLSNIVELRTIMSKQYFVVLQYQKVSAGNAGGLLSLGHGSEPSLTRSDFERIRTELNNRANTIAGGLIQLGLRVEALDTQQLIELFYSIYNPDVSSSERLTNVENLQASVISTEQGATQTPAAQPVAAPAAAPAAPATVAPAVSTLVAPGQTGSGDAIVLQPKATHLDAQIPVARVPIEAQKAAEKEEQPAASPAPATTEPAAAPTAPAAAPTEPPVAPVAETPPADVPLNVPPTSTTQPPPS